MIIYNICENTMKISAITITVLFFLSAGNYAKAQTGVMLGSTYSTAAGDVREQYDTGFHQGYAAGVYHNFDLLSEVLGIRPEFSYTEKGYTANFSSIAVTGEPIKMEYEYHFHYLILKVPIIYTRNPEDYFSPHFIAGPYAGYRFVAYENVSGTISNFSGSAKESIEPLDYGLIAGGGGLVDTGPGHLILELRFNWGLADFWSQEVGGERFNRGVQLLLGYQF